MNSGNTRVVPALMARRQFAQLVRQAHQRHERFIIQQRGEPRAVIMGIADFIRSFAPEPRILNIIGRQAERKGTSNLTMRQIDREIAAARREKRAVDARSKGRA